MAIHLSAKEPSTPQLRSRNLPSTRSSARVHCPCISRRYLPAAEHMLSANPCHRAYFLNTGGGKALKEDECSFFKNEIDRTRSEISDAGIEQLDERAPNMLWNEEVQRVMFVDFGRARVTRRRKPSGRKSHLSSLRGRGWLCFARSLSRSLESLESRHVREMATVAKESPAVRTRTLPQPVRCLVYPTETHPWLNLVV